MMTISEVLRKWLLQPVLDELTLVITKENGIMAQIDDLQAAIVAEEVDIAQIAGVATKIASDVAALLAQVAAGTTPTDLTAQIASINADAATLANAAGILAAADTSANPPAPAKA